jgi:4-amino-4-deoxychorismate lyase
MAATFNLHPETTYGDRAFNYGDGCFTTMLCLDRDIQLLTYHIARLESDTKKLHIPFTPADKITLYKKLSEMSEQLCTGIIKVHLSRGCGGRGYGVSGISGPNISLTQHAIPASFSDVVSLSIAATPISRQPKLAGTKHTSRLEQVLFKHSAEEAGTTDIICLDEFEHVIETSSANLFWHKNGQWYSPELSHSGVAGTYRACILDTLVAMNTPCKVGFFDLTELLGAESVIMCNAVRGIIAVDRVVIHSGFELNLHADKFVRTSEIEVNSYADRATKGFVAFSNTAVSKLQKQVDQFLNPSA